MAGHSLDLSHTYINCRPNHSRACALRLKAQVSAMTSKIWIASGRHFCRRRRATKPRVPRTISVDLAEELCGKSSSRTAAPTSACPVHRDANPLPSRQTHPIGKRVPLQAQISGAALPNGPPHARVEHQSAARVRLKHDGRPKLELRKTTGAGNLGANSNTQAQTMKHVGLQSMRAHVMRRSTPTRYSATWCVGQTSKSRHRSNR